eukprot:77662_1
MASSQKFDKLLSAAYSEIEGSKAGAKELSFVEAVFDFLNRQSTYLSDPKTSDKLLQITNKAIKNASKKKQAVNKKSKGKKGKKKGKKEDHEKIYTKADKTIDKEQVAADKKKLKKKIASAKDPVVKKDKYSATTKQQKKKAKAKKAKQDKAGVYTDDIKEEDTINNIERIESMYQQFNFKFKKDYKTLIKILGKPAAKRVASAYLIEICKVIRVFAPNVMVNDEKTRPIRGTDRAFRVSSNFEGKVYISDFEFAYELTEDPKTDKVWNADLISNHAICRHDASSVYVDHRSHVFFHELSSFKNEALMVFIPDKPAPKRTIQYKPLGDRCVYTDSFCHAKPYQLPDGYSVVFIKNGTKHLSLNKIPVTAGGKKLVRKEWTKFNQKLPNAEYLCLNKRHDAVFVLTTDLENMSIRLSCVILNKSVKKESKVIFVKQWEDFDFEEMGYAASGFWPKAISMCYLRDTNHVCVGIQKHLFLIGENPNEKYDYYTYYLGRTTCLVYDIAEHPRKKNAIIAVDGV